MLAQSALRILVLVSLSCLWAFKVSKFGPRVYSIRPLQAISNTDESRPVLQKQIMRFCASLFVYVSFSASVQAGWFSSPQQDLVDQVASYQKPVAELLDQLRPTEIPNAIGVYSKSQLLKGGQEDSVVVANYLDYYFKSMQQKMAEVAPQLSLPAEQQTKAETLPLLMKGHLLELQQAVSSQKVEDQAKEVEEVQETLADFLKLSNMKYTVTPYTPTRPLSDKELFGPLGCEFWGKTRVEGSNYCASPPEETSRSL
jgi:hypothetical protein